MTNQSPSEFSNERPTAPLERLLAGYAMLGHSDIERIREGIAGGEIAHGVGALLDDDLRRTPARLIAKGWVARAGVLADGRRQIVGLHLPGDLLTPAEGEGGDMTVWALTEAITIDAGRFWRAVENETAPDSRLGAAWRQIREVERARLVHQIIRLGRLTAYERTAHLFLELHDKQLRAGLTDTGAVQLPITQDVLADSLGLSAVHMNRTLQQLRRDGLIVYRGGQLLLPDLRGLRQAARLSSANEAETR
ncbi:Crp/Fnr family transcriptional regulator [Brevundimonas intermedia]|uniref:Crp/Fnr family transcriptional regulator n=2 Tax=Brevundimonas intermedia TaxID=74315 RepID=A0A4Y9RZN8_9CAUL|nr:Crp/Fnr family transcriptional regulator [Brevundimonas intermedia]